MAVRPIVKYPDPRLREKCAQVTEITDEIRALVRDMADTMYAANGAGLAAIQVGAAVRIFLADAAIAGGREEDPPLVFINPEIVWGSDEMDNGEEGCLSFPGIYVPIKRHLRAKVRAMDLEGKTFEAEGEGLYARAMQHETDHLNGKLMIDFVGPLKRTMINKKMKRWHEEEAADDGGADAETP